jgi:hypothetical protein
MSREAAPVWSDVRCCCCGFGPSVQGASGVHEARQVACLKRRQCLKYRQRMGRSPGRERYISIRPHTAAVERAILLLSARLP